MAGGGSRFLRAIGSRVGTTIGPPSLSPISLPYPSAPIASGWQHLSSHLLCEDEEELDGFWRRETAAFGPPPSTQEALQAVDAIQQVFIPVTLSQISEEGSSSYISEESLDKALTSMTGLQNNLNADPELDWIEPPAHLYNRSILSPHNVVDAFFSLQTDPSIQKLVLSLSSDKAVWDAVMKNDAVRELRETLFTESSRFEAIKELEDDPSDIPTRFLQWILENTKARIMELFDTIAKLASKLFYPQEKGKKMEGFDSAVRSSFMLSVVVFIVVVVFRIHRTSSS